MVDRNQVKGIAMLLEQPLLSLIDSVFQILMLIHDILAQRYR